MLMRKHSGTSSGLICGIGDDCAVIRKDSELSWLVTMDTLIESVHFDLAWHPPYKIGRKAIAVNVSDIAAMGGTPLFVFLSLGLPAGYDPLLLKGISDGIADACAAFGCILAGGDTVRSPNGIVITITAIGEARTADIVYRHGARTGDAVWVSGFLGNAAGGLELCRNRLHEHPAFTDLVAAHLDPQPRLQLGARLAEKHLVHAMMDLSDGLATDLAHLCQQSSKGAVINMEKLPLSAALVQASEQLHLDPYLLMVSGGEDFELVFTAASDQTEGIETLAAETGLKVTRIGWIDSGEGVRALQGVAGQENQVEVDISFKGFDHFADAVSDEEQ
jgi:thiamine-monophosphate kinase